MNIKVLFILLILLLISNNSTKQENLSDDFMNKASGGILNKDKTSPFANKNKDPNSATFMSDIDTVIDTKTENDRTVIVNEDTQELDINNEADVEQIIGDEDDEDVEDDEDDEGSGCSDILLFGIILLIIIYIIYFQINKQQLLPLSMD
jgi:hypothetical protein